MSISVLITPGNKRLSLTKSYFMRIEAYTVKYYLSFDLYRFFWHFLSMITDIAVFFSHYCMNWEKGGKTNGVG